MGEVIISLLVDKSWWWLGNEDPMTFWDLQKTCGWQANSKPVPTFAHFCYNLLKVVVLKL